MMISWLKIVLLFNCLSAVIKVDGETGILQLRSSGKKFCMAYNSRFNSLPPEESSESLGWQPLSDLTPDFLCTEENSTLGASGAIWAVSRGNCTFSEKAQIVQQNRGAGLLIVTDSSLFPPSANQSSDYSDINITVAMVTKDDFSQIQEEDGSQEVRLYSVLNSKSDPSMLVLLILAVGTMMTGSGWSGIVKYNRYKRQELVARPGNNNTGGEHTGGDVDMTLPGVVILVIMMIALLLALYFFYDYLVYVVIAMFALAGSMGLYSCTISLWIKLPLGTCSIPGIPLKRCSLLSRPTEVRRLCLWLICLAVGVTWFIIRNYRYGWLLQDVLAISFSIHVIKVLRVPNLKVLMLLLVLLFIYDIFFVFITPLFTPDGDSIMVKVATGGDKSKEQLPMLLKVPRLSRTDFIYCMESPFSLLGLGDIVVPGILVGYCHGYDLITGTPARLYYLTTSAAYGVGLVLTYVALIMMEQGQPALLYIVPCIVLTAVAVAVGRGELARLWRGPITGEVTSVESDGSWVDPPEDGEHKRQSSASDTSDEQNSLLKNA